MSNYYLAYLFDDLSNVDDYAVTGNAVEGNKCYYKGELIGEMWCRMENDGLNVYYKPYRTVDYISVDIVVDKEGNFKCND